MLADDEVMFRLFHVGRIREMEAGARGIDSVGLRQKRDAVGQDAKWQSTEDVNMKSLAPLLSLFDPFGLVQNHRDCVEDVLVRVRFGCVSGVGMAQMKADVNREDIARRL